MTDEEFMTHVICEIAEYAIKNDMEPDDTLRTMANNILQLLEISTFNNIKLRMKWKNVLRQWWHSMVEDYACTCILSYMRM